MNVTIMYRPSELHVYSVLIYKKHFNHIGANFLTVRRVQFTSQPIGSRSLNHMEERTMCRPIGLKCLLENNQEYMGSSESPYIIATSVAMGQALNFLNMNVYGDVPVVNGKNANTMLTFIHDSTIYPYQSIR